MQWDTIYTNDSRLSLLLTSKCFHFLYKNLLKEWPFWRENMPFKPNIWLIFCIRNSSNDKDNCSSKLFRHIYAIRDIVIWDTESEIHQRWNWDPIYMTYLCCFRYWCRYNCIGWIWVLQLDSFFSPMKNDLPRTSYGE